MAPLSIDIPLRIRFQGSMHLGTGRAEGLIDRTVRRNAEGDPYVPGSALKGALRMTAERLVRQLNEVGGLEPEMHIGKRRRGDTVLSDYCRAPRPEQMCQGRDPCIVCRLFGNVFTGSRLHVGNAQAAQDTPQQRSLEALFEQEEPASSPSGSVSHASATDVRTRLRIDRRRQGAEEGALFTSEYSRPVAVYEAPLSGTIPITPLRNAADLPAELVLLAAGIAATDQIGGESTTGNGTCRLRPEDCALIDVEGAEDDRSDAGVFERAEEPPYPLGALVHERALNALAWYRFDN